MASPWTARARILAGTWLAVHSWSACKSDTKTVPRKVTVTAAETQLVPAAPVNSPFTPPGPPPTATAAALQRRVPLDADQGLVSNRWVLDRVVDIAEAAPATASEQGVVVIDALDSVHLAHLGALSASKDPGDTPVTPINDATLQLKRGRGPRVLDGQAYWVSASRLKSAPIAAQGPGRILVTDARFGTRPSPLANWVAYIALPSEPDGPLTAKLWYAPGATPLSLTPEGSSALSVHLLKSGSRFFAAALEARTGGSSLHVSELLPGDPPRAGADQVVWVGGAAQPMTEAQWVPAIHATDQQIVSLLPAQQSVTQFGLALIHFSELAATLPPAVQWSPYLNGIEPAPVSSAPVCGEPAVLFAKPSTALPRAPQELVLARLVNGSLKDEVVVARARAFFDVSAAALKEGALLSYVADGRTWARTVRCR